MIKNILKYPTFLERRHKLDPKFRWKVDVNINNICRYDGDMRKFADSAQCELLPVKNKQGYYVFNIGKDNKGYMRIKLTVHHNTKYNFIACLDCKFV